MDLSPAIIKAALRTLAVLILCSVVYVKTTQHVRETEVAPLQTQLKQLKNAATAQAVEVKVDTKQQVDNNKITEEVVALRIESALDAYKRRNPSGQRPAPCPPSGLKLDPNAPAEPVVEVPYQVLSDAALEAANKILSAPTTGEKVVYWEDGIKVTVETLAMEQP